MGIMDLPCNPLVTEGCVTFPNGVLSGVQPGDVFDFKSANVSGKLMAVFLSNDLTSDTITNGEVLYKAATGITAPGGARSGGFTVTNTKANALGGNNNYAVFAGIALATVAEPSAATAAVAKMVLILIDGYHSAIKTNGDDDIVDGDYLIHSGNGTCDSVAQNDTTNQTSALLALKIGRAVAADSDSANTVAGFIKADWSGI